MLVRRRRTGCLRAGGSPLTARSEHARAAAAWRASRRIRIAALLVVLGVIGLAARFGLPGALGDWAGGIAYTAFAYGLVAFAWPELRARAVALAAFAFSAAVELLQLAGAAQALVDVWSPLRLVVGQSFVAADFVAYAIGAALAAWLDRRLSPAWSERAASVATSS